MNEKQPNNYLLKILTIHSSSPQKLNLNPSIGKISQNKNPTQLKFPNSLYS